ncbi:MAG TPA: carboxypeptidase regulatory-like domain-containing protein [Terriglobia bacterium]|nr:carboxypeptidase regulatory-like domain-containing protein [Terriglobia bacterium]
MKRTLAFIMLMLSAPAGAQIGRGVVTGRIRAADGQPAAGARVAAMEVSDPNVAVSGASLLASITETDSDGRYRLDDLPPGRYYVVVGKLDTPTYYPGAKTVANARAVAVTAGATVAGIDFTASLPLRVKGRVRGLDSAQLATAPRALLIGGTVSTDTATGFVPGNRQISAPVAPDGSFEIRDVPPGAYTIVLRAAREDYIVRIPSNPASGPVIVLDERDVTDVLVTFPTILTGRVVADQEGPVPAFLLTFAVPGAPPIQVSVSSQHEIEASLPQGTYRVAVSGLAEGYKVRSILYGGTDVLHAPLVVTDTSNIDSRIVINLDVASPPPWVRINGQVVGAGNPRIAGPVMFGIFSETLGLEFQAPVQADGSFKFIQAPAGTYEGWFDPEPEGINPIAIVVGKSDPFSMRIDLPARVNLSGRVIVADDAPLPGGAVRLIGMNAPRASGGAEVLPVSRELILHPDGAFAMAFPEGEYRVTLDEPAGPYAVKGIAEGTNSLPRETLRITGAGTREVSVMLSVTTFAVKGRVHSGGHPIPADLRVAIAGTGLATPHDAPISADGTFEFPKIPPGTYTLRIGQDGMPISIDVAREDVIGLEFGLLRGKVISSGDSMPPSLVISFSNDAAAPLSYVRPDIRADGAFESALPLGKARAHLAGYQPHYAIRLVRDGQSDVMPDGAEFQFSADDDLELQVIFQP